MSTILFGVFGHPKMGRDLALLGVYSTRERAQGLIDAQPAELHPWLWIEEITVDQDPDDECWVKRPR